MSKISKYRLKDLFADVTKLTRSKFNTLIDSVWRNKDHNPVTIAQDGESETLLSINENQELSISFDVECRGNLRSV